jgi:Tol biopolymer transport system component
VTRGLGLATAAFVALIAATGVTATPPGRNGLIVYAQELRPDHYQLFTIRPDGSGAKQITHNLPSVVNPDWYGNTIVAEVVSDSGAGIALFTAAGTLIRYLAPKGFQGQPSYSPDGKWIVYERDIAPGNNGVWLMRSNGTKLHRVTRNPFMLNGECGCDTDPNFSPNGKWISFVRIKKDHEQQALFAVRPNGTGLHRITPYSWEIATKHDWSPDGTLIVLTTNADYVRPNESANLVTIRPDGSGMKNLTNFTGRTENAFAGSFSPDGTKIVFRIESGDTNSLAIIDREGAKLQRITTGKGRPRFIDWGSLVR